MSMHRPAYGAPIRRNLKVAAIFAAAAAGVVFLVCLGVVLGDAWREPASARSTPSSSAAACGGAIYPAALTAGVVDNYNPIGLWTTCIIDQLVAGDVRITGLAALPKGAIKIIRNNCNSSGTLTLVPEQDPSSGDAFFLPNNQSLAIPPCAAATIEYSDSGWLLLSTTSGPIVDVLRELSGTVALLGDGRATVTTSHAYAQCLCTDKSNVQNVECSVSGKTVTMVGTPFDQIAFLCEP